MQSIESNVSNFKVDAVFNGKPAQPLKKLVGIGLVGVKHDTRQEIMSFPKFGNVFPEWCHGGQSSRNGIVTLSYYTDVFMLVSGADRPLLGDQHG